jgi:hypothetical protein
MIFLEWKVDMGSSQGMRGDRSTLDIPLFLQIIKATSNLSQRL